MSERRNVQDLLAHAERAASTGDLASAKELLEEAAKRQESELGPSHPDLANILNNLAVVAEKTGRLDEAERSYRRAVAIASASLAPDDSIVAEARQNLEDFCRAHGRPIDQPAVTRPAVDEPAPAEAPVASGTALPSLPVSEKASRALTMLAIGVAALVIAVLFLARPWSSHGTSTAVPPAAPTTAPAHVADAPQPSPKTSAPIDKTPSTKTESAAARAPAPARTTVALVTAQLCRHFSTSTWRCDPAGDSVSPGPMVLYTRVRSPRDGVIVHRWYRGDTLRKSAQLRIAANLAEGYRTFSRQTVDRGEWRVEVRSAAGDLLHEQRFAVR
jgi:hypothetical protein